MPGSLLGPRVTAAFEEWPTFRIRVGSRGLKRDKRRSFGLLMVDTYHLGPRMDVFVTRDECGTLLG